MTTIEILGVYPFKDDDPLADPDLVIHLIEVRISGDADTIDFGEFTQEFGENRDFCQVAYEEEAFDENADIWTFFFHFLDLNKPLLTPVGPITLPEPKPLPDRYRGRDYDAP